MFGPQYLIGLDQDHKIGVKLLEMGLLDLTMHDCYKSGFLGLAFKLK